MVVDHDHRAGAQLQGAFDHLARINRGVIDGPALLNLVGNKFVAVIEEQDPELFGLSRGPCWIGNRPSACPRIR